MVLANSFSHDILWDIKKKGGLGPEPYRRFKQEPVGRIRHLSTRKTAGKNCFSESQTCPLLWHDYPMADRGVPSGRSRHASFAETAAACFLLDERELLT
ncbi:hypothetical protein [Paenibacillus naphthalenovorans]|uniref:hypothetical protein n=1 Tax=Paenibacillus naphthalenovorans TaxID=162209 RepID=UPI003D275077